MHFVRRYRVSQSPNWAPRSLADRHPNSWTPARASNATRISVFWHIFTSLFLPLWPVFPISPVLLSTLVSNIQYSYNSSKEFQQGIFQSYMLPQRVRPRFLLHFAICDRMTHLASTTLTNFMAATGNFCCKIVLNLWVKSVGTLFVN